VKTFQLGLVMCSLLAFAAASAQAPPSEATLTQNPVFQKNCARCHGKTAEGRRHFGGPSLISERVVSTPADDLRNIINRGQGRMPKYASKLTPEDIDTLVVQIKGLQKK